MEKTATLHLPDSINMDLMSQEEIHRKLQKGLSDVESGNTKLSAKAFEEFKERYKE